MREQKSCTDSSNKYNQRLTIQSSKLAMQTDPYNWPFPKRQDTMYLQSISNKDIPFLNRSFMRQSTFQSKDIFGAVPRNLVSENKYDTNFSLSTYVQPRPQVNRIRHSVTNPLKIDDIEGAQPKANQFRTRRIVDPLAPKYQLASCSAFSVDPGRRFIRDTLKIQDINPRKQKRLGGLEPRDPILGSTSMARTKELHGVSRLNVKDINKQQVFESNRHTNPLTPNYNWRDDDRNLSKINTTYGNIEGARVRKLHPEQVHKNNTFCLNVKDIEGSSSNSCFDRAHFMDKRREFRNYMNVKDIEKTDPSSLKKGIVTKRQTNPLMPSYQFLGPIETNIKK